MAKIVTRDRQIGGYKYITCKKCHEVIEIEHPLELAMPYCSDCGMVVLDLAQNYCCWCGKPFTE